MNDFLKVCHFKAKFSDCVSALFIKQNKSLWSKAFHLFVFIFHIALIFYLSKYNFLGLLTKE